MGAGQGKNKQNKPAAPEKNSKKKGKEKEKLDDKEKQQEPPKHIMVENIDEFEMKSNEGENDKSNNNLLESEQNVKRSLEPRYDFQTKPLKNNNANKILDGALDRGTEFNFSKRNVDEIPMNSSRNIPIMKNAATNDVRIPTDQSETDLFSKYKNKIKATPEKQPTNKINTVQDSINLNPIDEVNKKQVPQRKNTQKDETKAIIPREEVTTPQKNLNSGIIWGGYQDETPVWFVSFHVKYDQESQQFLMVKTYDHLNLATMKLSTIKKGKGDNTTGSFQVEIGNQELFNLKNGTKKIFSKTPKMVFPITTEGKSTGSLDYKEILEMAEENIAGEYNIGYLKKLYDVEKKKIWTMLVEAWVNNPESSIIKTIMNFGREVLVINTHKKVNEEFLKSYLKQKLTNPSFLETAMNCEKTIMNKLRKWERDEEGEENYRLDKSKLILHANEKYENHSGLIESSTSRPHLINSEFTKKIIFEYKGDLFVDIEQEIRLCIPLWKDIPDIGKEPYVMGEISKFREFCDTNFKQTLLEAAAFPLIPLKNKPKLVGHNSSILIKGGPKYMNRIGSSGEKKQNATPSRYLTPSLTNSKPKEEKKPVDASLTKTPSKSQIKEKSRNRSPLAKTATVNKKRESSPGVSGLNRERSLSNRKETRSQKEKTYDIEMTKKETPITSHLKKFYEKVMKSGEKPSCDSSKPPKPKAYTMNKKPDETTPPSKNAQKEGQAASDISSLRERSQKSVDNSMIQSSGFIKKQSVRSVEAKLDFDKEKRRYKLKDILKNPSLTNNISISKDILADEINEYMEIKSKSAETISNEIIYPEDFWKRSEIVVNQRRKRNLNNISQRALVNLKDLSVELDKIKQDIEKIRKNIVALKREEIKIGIRRKGGLKSASGESIDTIKMKLCILVDTKSRLIQKYIIKFMFLFLCWKRDINRGVEDLNQICQGCLEKLVLVALLRNKNVKSEDKKVENFAKTALAETKMRKVLYAWGDFNNRNRKRIEMLRERETQRENSLMRKCMGGLIKFCFRKRKRICSQVIAEEYSKFSSKIKAMKSILMNLTTKQSGNSRLETLEKVSFLIPNIEFFKFYLSNTNSEILDRKESYVEILKENDRRRSYRPTSGKTLPPFKRSNTDSRGILFDVKSHIRSIIEVLSKLKLSETNKKGSCERAQLIKFQCLQKWKSSFLNNWLQSDINLWSTIQYVRFYIFKKWRERKRNFRIMDKILYIANDKRLMMKAVKCLKTNAINSINEKRAIYARKVKAKVISTWRTLAKGNQPLLIIYKKILEKRAFTIKNKCFAAMINYSTDNKGKGAFFKKELKKKFLSLWVGKFKARVLLRKTFEVLLGDAGSDKIHETKLPPLDIQKKSIILKSWRQLVIDNDGTKDLKIKSLMAENHRKAFLKPKVFFTWVQAAKEIKSLRKLIITTSRVFNKNVFQLWRQSARLKGASEKRLVQKFSSRKVKLSFEALKRNLLKEKLVKLMRKKVAFNVLKKYHFLGTFYYNRILKKKTIFAFLKYGKIMQDKVKIIGYVEDVLNRKQWKTVRRAFLGFVINKEKRKRSKFINHKAGLIHDSKLLDKFFRGLPIAMFKIQKRRADIRLAEYFNAERKSKKIKFENSNDFKISTRVLGDDLKTLQMAFNGWRGWFLKRRNENMIVQRFNKFRRRITQRKFFIQWHNNYLREAFKHKGQHTFRVDYDRYLTSKPREESVSQVSRVSNYYPFSSSHSQTLNDITQTLNTRKKTVRFADESRSSLSKKEEDDWYSRSLDESRSFWMEKYREQEEFLRKLQETKILEQKYLENIY